MIKMIAGFVLAALMTGNVAALSSESAIIAQYNKKASAEHVDYNDASLIKVTYVGSAAQAVVGVTATAFTTEAPLGTADLTIDISAAAYDTLGELCDYLQAQDDYNCSLTGGKRNDSSGLLKNVTAAAATDAKAVGGYAVLIDTGGAVATDPDIMRVGITPASGKRVVLKGCRVQNDGVGSLTVYGKLAKYHSVSDGVTRNDTTLLWTEPTADDTAESVPSSLIEGGWLEFAADEHVVVSAGNAAITQTSTSFLECFWDEK